MIFKVSKLMLLDRFNAIVTQKGAKSKDTVCIYKSSQGLTEAKFDLK